MIFAEIPQGLASDAEARAVEEHLRAFPVLRLEGLADFDRLASCSSLRIFT